MNIFLPIFACALAYLIGSISFAILLSKIFRLQDPRRYGSRNPGATNVLRSGNKPVAALVLLLDGGKGAVAVLFAPALVYLFNVFTPNIDFLRVGSTTLAMVGLSVFVGHIWPLFHRFKGGKGVATFMGVTLALSWPIGLVALLAWLVIALISRYSSLAALFSTLIALLSYALAYEFDAIFFTLFVMFGLLVARHQGNITNFLQGKEKKIGAR